MPSVLRVLQKLPWRKLKGSRAAIATTAALMQQQLSLRRYCYSAAVLYLQSWCECARRRSS